MSKLYVGNLPADVNEGSLRQLFQEHGLPCTMVLVKRGGYAFVDCPDQTTADRAIDKLNGFNFLGSSLVVEPSVAGGGAKRGGAPRVVLSGIPGHVSQEEVEPLLSNVGPIQTCERIPPRDGATTQAYIVTFESSEVAQVAINQLNGYEFEGAALRADWASDRRSRSRSARPTPPFSGIPGGARQMDFPLRILVQSDMVGAIIGRQGSTIRQITQQTRARVDVHRKDNVGSLEKAITIYGNPDNCSNACKRILEVMQQEASSTNKGEICLKMLAHNNLIGRIIGKGGNTIKRIMQDTDTKITVSSINDISSFNLERIITVKGAIEGMAKAESLISGKLKQSYESDLQAMAPQSLMFPGLHPMAMMSTLGMGFSRGAGFSGMYGSGPTPYPPMYPPAMPAQPGGQAVVQFKTSPKGLPQRRRPNKPKTN